MCRACRPKPEIERAHRLIEQTLSWLGLIRPGCGRAQGGAPREILDGLTLDLNRLWDELAAALEETIVVVGGIAVLDESALQSLLISVQSRFESLLTEAVEASLKAGLEHAAQQLDIEIVFGGVDASQLSALQGQAVNLCENTLAKISGDVHQSLMESVRLQENMTQAIARLQSISSLTPYEAERIARTELAKAANTGRLLGYKGRAAFVVWVLGPTYRGGCECGDFAGKVYTLDEAMGMSMPLHPNCDCMWRPATDEEVQEYLAA